MVYIKKNILTNKCLCFIIVRQEANIIYKDYKYKVSGIDRYNQI